MLLKTLSKISGSAKNVAAKSEDLFLLVVRVVLGLNFYMPATGKLEDVTSTAAFFREIGIPFATLNVYLAGGLELIAVVLLPLGVGVRVLSVLLSFLLLVAVFTLHLENGWAAGNNGMEIAVYYIMFLWLLLIKGPGRYSAENLVKRGVKIMQER